MEKRTDWIQTYTGRAFWPLEPDADRLWIGDIAWSLSMQCRYAGHTQRFYSIAEHSVHVSYAVPGYLALCALLHDASEAYLVDIPRPVKVFIANYAEYEDRLMMCIAERYGFEFPFPQVVKNVDNQILFNERDALLAPSEIPWSWDIPPLEGVMIAAWPQQEAYERFMARFNELYQEN